jgi:hypothetical protein
MLLMSEESFGPLVGVMPYGSIGEAIRLANSTRYGLASYGERVRDLKGIDLSGQMHGLVALDENGAVTRPSILWNDQRSSGQCDDVYEAVGGPEALLEHTNNRMLPGYTGGKILWLRENEPGSYRRLKKVLNPKDYVRFRLTGEYATEVSDTSGTGLFDVKSRSWEAGGTPSFRPSAPESPKATCLKPQSARQSSSPSRSAGSSKIRKADSRFSATSCRPPGTRWASPSQRAVPSSG